MSLKELNKFIKEQERIRKVRYRKKLRGMPKVELQEHLKDLPGTVRTNPNLNMATFEFLRRSDGGVARTTRVF
jgi:hypothetical protein